MRAKDELYSLQKFIFDLYGVANHSQRRISSVIRPYFRILQAANFTTNLGTIGWMDSSAWVLWYHGITETDTRTVVGDLIRHFKTKPSIDGYLDNFIYPTPLLEAVTNGGGSISTGTTVYVAITGIRGGLETLASSVASVVVTTPNNAVRIQFPKLPIWKANFDSYNVYAGSTSTVTLQTNVLQNADKLINTQYDLLTLISGAAVPSASAVQYGRILINEIESETMEDEIEDGTWDGRLVLSTSSQGLLTMDPSNDVASDGRLIKQVTLAENNNLLSVTIPVVL